MIEGRLNGTKLNGLELTDVHEACVVVTLRDEIVDGLWPAPILTDLAQTLDAGRLVRECQLEQYHCNTTPFH